MAIVQPTEPGIGTTGIGAERFAQGKRRQLGAGRDSSSGPGDTLPAETRARLEPHLGFDVSRARIHTGTEAHEAARSLDAEAFTVGHDVYFAEGRFDPSSSRGTRLLAHELAHVRQQAIDDHSPVAARQAAGAGAGGAVDDDRLIQPGAQSPAPSMKFAMKAPQTAMATPPPPSETSSKGGGDSKADPRAVADRVYDLMKQEFELGRQRGIVASRRRRR